MAVLLLAAALATGCMSAAEREAERNKRQRQVETQVQLAAAYMQRNQLDAAKNNLDRALELNDEDSQANNVMAVLQWRLKEYEQAERYFRRAIAYSEKNSAAYHNYGAFLCDRGRVDEGLQVLEKAAANLLYAGAAEANLNAGLCLMTKPAPMAAEKYFREALRINPNLPGALYQMARVSYDSGRTLPARGFIQRYFQLAPDSPEALLLAVRIETAMKDKDNAASFALRLKSKFPTSPEAQQLARDRAGHDAQPTTKKQ
jgi:type IV pilus assembly protein PilF